MRPAAQRAMMTHVTTCMRHAACGMRRSVVHSALRTPRSALKRGQSTVEYAVVIAVVIGALLTMQIYMKRGTQGKLRDATDQIGEQFSPRGTTYKYTTETHSARQEKLETAPRSFGKSSSTIQGQGPGQEGETQTKTFVSPEIVDTNQ